MLNADLLASYGVSVNQVLQDGSVLAIEDLVREVPQQRLVCRGIWQEKRVYAKLFFGERARIHCSRDMAGVAMLKARNIATPNNIYAGNSQEPFCLLFEEISNAQNAEQCWLTLDKEQRFALATQLVVTVAQHHNAGLLQTDLYLKNFLIQGDKVFTLDGDGIRKLTSTKQAMQNLAVLLSKLDVLKQAEWQTDLLKTYCQARGIFDGIQLSTLVPQQAFQHRIKSASHYADKKVFRDCTDVSVSQYPWAFQAWSNAFYLPNNNDFDALIEAGSRLKSGNTCTVAVNKINGVKLVIKRYNIKGFAHALSRALRPTRAACSWSNAHRLKLLGIATAAPIALIERRKFGFLRGKAYFISEFVDAPDVAEFFEKTLDENLRVEAINHICQLFYKLFLLQISHGDTKASNIKIQALKPVLIDLDSMRQHNHVVTSSVAHCGDLQRFMQNWQNDIPLYNAFVEAFKANYNDTSLLIKAGIFQNK